MTNRTYHLLLQLQREFDVTLVPFFRTNHQPSPADREQARVQLSAELDRVYPPSPIGGEVSTGRRITDHLRSLTTSRAYTYFEYASRQFAESVKGAVASGAPSLCHLDSLDLYRYLGTLPDMPVACTHHSVESDLLRLRAERLRGWLLPWYVRHQAGLLETVERTVTPQLALNVMMSDVDSERLRRIAPDARTVTIPNGVDSEYFQPRRGRALSGRVIFVGPSYSYPNRDAIDYFLDEIWPLVRRDLGRSSFEIIGRSGEKDSRRFAENPNVVVSGHVPDLRENLAQAECVVVPIRIGGGTRLKILDAWAMGKAVVSTSIGCEGLAAVDGENILICDTARGFAESVIAVLGSADLRERLGQAGRDTITSHYTWDQIGMQLRAAYWGTITS